MISRQPPVGIDLGTTYSAVAYLDDERHPSMVPNDEGDVLTPSAIFVDEDTIVVGKQAVKASSMKPEAYAECFKRDMGGATFRRKVLGNNVPPEVLSAFVLERLRGDVERRLGAYRKAVITVPAFFDENRRRATQEAGHLAGWDVLDIINEPTAAAVAFGHDRGVLDASGRAHTRDPRRVLVYDLGGGTFDVTVLEIEGARFRTLATDGDVRLGGKDFDKRLVDHLARRFIESHGLDPRSDPQDAAQLWQDAQDLKHALSERTKVTTMCFHGGIRERIEVNRAEFEEMTGDLVVRTETTVSLVMRQAGIDFGEIDHVLLVGGSTRMPMIRTMLRDLTGKEPECSQSPDEAVAYGAAYYADSLLAGAADSQKPACELINVNSHSLGVVGTEPKTRHRRNVILIPKNTPLPTRAAGVFCTLKADQRSVRVRVVEGESDRPEDCIALGECVVRNLPTGLAAQTKIEVEYSYAANGRISIVARIPSIRHSAHVEIERDHASELEELRTWRARLLGTVETSDERFGQAAEVVTVDLTDKESLRKRLDVLHVEVGKAALRFRVPGELIDSRNAALSAVSEAADARSALEESRQTSSDATLHDPAALRQTAAVSRAKAAYDQAAMRAEFTCLVLGRECFARGFTPPGVEKAVQEIGDLAGHLEQLK